MSASWLTPRISGFWKSHPDIVVSQIVSDTGVPVGQCGPCPSSTARCRRMAPDCRPRFHDRIMALGAPSYAQDRKSRQPGGPAGAAADPCDGGGSRLDRLGGLVRSPRPWRARRAAASGQHLHDRAADGAGRGGAVLGWDGLVGPLLDQAGWCRWCPRPSPLRIRSPAAEPEGLRERAALRRLAGGAPG